MEVVVDDPLDGEGRLVREVNGDGNAAVRGGRVGPRQRGEEEARGGGLNHGSKHWCRGPHQRQGWGAMEPEKGLASLYWVGGRAGSVAEHPRLIRLKCSNQCHKDKLICPTLQTE